MNMTFLMRIPICKDTRGQIISWMEIQTWLLLTERTTNFTKTDARIAIAGVTILVHLNTMHLPFDQCAIQKKLPNLRILFF